MANQNPGKMSSGPSSFENVLVTIGVIVAAPFVIFLWISFGVREAKKGTTYVKAGWDASNAVSEARSNFKGLLDQYLPPPGKALEPESHAANLVELVDHTKENEDPEEDLPASEQQSDAALRGKLLVLDLRKREIDDAHGFLPAKLRACSPDEVDVLVWLDWQRGVYRYSGGGTYSISCCDIRFVERDTFRCILKSTVSSSKSPPKRKPVGQHQTFRPTREVAESIAESYRREQIHRRLDKIGVETNVIDMGDGRPNLIDRLVESGIYLGTKEGERAFRDILTEYGIDVAALEQRK